MKLGKVDNKTGSKVEAHVASCPVLSLFRREEPKDGDTGLPYTLHNYRSTATPYIATVTSSGSIVGAGGLFTVFTVLEKRWLGCVARANIVIKSE